jgi:hypothetical protein
MNGCGRLSAGAVLEALQPANSLRDSLARSSLAISIDAWRFH